MLPGGIRQSPSQTPRGYCPDRPSPGPGCAPRRSPDLTLTATPHARRPQPDRLPPIGPRSWCAGTRFRWSGAYTATLSGAVSAGSNPAGAQLRGVNSNNLGALERQACDLRQCPALRDLAPDTRLEAGTSEERACSAASGDNGRQAVARTADRCSLLYPQPRSGSVDSARVRLSSPSDRLRCPLARRLHPGTSAPHPYAPDPPDLCGQPVHWRPSDGRLGRPGGDLGLPER
jgi:hypothetical protein